MPDTEDYRLPENSVEDESKRRLGKALLKEKFESTSYKREDAYDAQQIENQFRKGTQGKGSFGWGGLKN